MRTPPSSAAPAACGPASSSAPPVSRWARCPRCELVDGGQRVQVDFNVDRSLPLYQSTTAQIRYQDLIGNRYLELQRGQGEGADRVLPPGGFIPLSRTQPALDLDALIGGFKPLFRALDPDKVNNIAQSIITVFQGQGGTISDILDQTAQLTSALADRDQAIGEVITNLNTVLATTVKHQKEFDQTVNNFEVLITGLKNRADPIADATADISDAAGTLGDLLADNRPVLKDTIGAPREHRPAAGGQAGRGRRPADQAAAVRSRSSAVPAASTATSSTSICATSRCSSTGYSPVVRSARSRCSPSRRVGARRNENPRRVEPDPQRPGRHPDPDPGDRGRDRASPASRCCSRSRPTTASSPIPAASSRATRCGSRAWTSAQCGRLAIDGDHVLMGFSLGGNRIGTESRLAIRTDTILGKKVLEVEPRGS